MDSMDSRLGRIQRWRTTFFARGFQFVKLNFSHNGTSRRILGLRGFRSFGANNFEKSLKISGALLVHLKTKVLPIA
jgi:hypothetical protein